MYDNYTITSILILSRLRSYKVTDYMYFKRTLQFYFSFYSLMTTHYLKIKFKRNKKLKPLVSKSMNDLREKLLISKSMNDLGEEVTAV